MLWSGFWIRGPFCSRQVPLKPHKFFKLLPICIANGSHTHTHMSLSNIYIHMCTYKCRRLYFRVRMWFQKRLGQSIKMQRAKTPWPQTLSPSLSFSLLFAGRKSILSCRSHHKYGRSNGGSVYGQVLFACVYVLPLLMTIC